MCNTIYMKNNVHWYMFCLGYIHRSVFDCLAFWIFPSLFLSLSFSIYLLFIYFYQNNFIFFCFLLLPTGNLLTLLFKSSVIIILKTKHSSCFCFLYFFFFLIGKLEESNCFDFLKFMKIYGNFLLIKVLQIWGQNLEPWGAFRWGIWKWRSLKTQIKIPEYKILLFGNFAACVCESTCKYWWR